MYVIQIQIRYELFAIYLLVQGSAVSLRSLENLTEHFQLHNLILGKSYQKERLHLAHLQEHAGDP